MAESEETGHIDAYAGLIKVPSHMGSLYFAEPCEGTFIVLTSPDITIGRTSNKDMPWELCDDTLLYPYRRLSRRQMTIKSGNGQVAITNVGRNPIEILLRLITKNGEYTREELNLGIGEQRADVSLPCIISFYHHVTNESYGTYYYGCPLFPRLSFVSNSGMLAQVEELLYEVQSVLSLPHKVPEQHIFNLVFSRYSSPNLVLAEVVDCLEPRTLAVLLDTAAKLVSLQPYYQVLNDLADRIQPIETIHGLVFSVDPIIYNLAEPPCLQEHRAAYTSVVYRQQELSPSPVDPESSIRSTLNGAMLLSIDSGMDELFNSDCGKLLNQAGIVGIIECTSEGPSIVKATGKLAVQIDMGRLKSFYSRCNIMIIIYPDEKPRSWINTLLEPNQEKNALYITIRTILDMSKPIYIASKFQFAGILYYRKSHHLSNFSFPILGETRCSDVLSADTQQQSIPEPDSIKEEKESSNDIHNTPNIVEPPIARLPESPSIISLTSSSDSSQRDQQSDTSIISIL